MKKRALTLSLCLLLSHVQAAPQPAKQPTMTGRGGAVATVDLDASRAAMDILNRGGNAVDAAVAAAATLGVTEPFSCGIGGGGFMLIYNKKLNKVFTVDHRETAPKFFTPDVFTENGKELEWEEAAYSGLSVGVPGTVKGWEEALSKYGSMKLSAVLQPAIRVARNGFTVDEHFQQQTEYSLDKFRAFKSSSALYLKNGEPLKVGTTLRNPDLARAYDLLARGGSKVFYQGEIASAIVRTANQPPVNAGSKLKVRPGHLALSDLAGYKTEWRAPVATTYRDFTVYGMQPPSSGGTAIAESLNILEGFDLAKMDKATFYHHYLEALRLAWADRNAYLADPSFTKVPYNGLISKGYAAQRRQLIGEKAMGVAEPGDPMPFQTSGSQNIKLAVHNREGQHTTHINVSDKYGNIVSYTTTIEDWGGNGMVVPGYGFLLNNEMTDFDFDPQAPNAPQAGKRPRSSMSPTLVFKKDQPVLAIGAPGGYTIISTVLQGMLNILDRNLSPVDAIAAVRFTQSNSEEVEVDLGGEKSDLAAALMQRGHKFAPLDENGFMTAIQFLPDGRVTAAAEARRGGGGSALVQFR